MSNRFYINFDTQERVPATYEVHLTRRAYYDAFVTVEATSEEEARTISLASDWSDEFWELDRGDPDDFYVNDVTCKQAPDGAVLIEQGYHNSDANLAALFETEPSFRGSAQSIELFPDH